MAIHGSPELSPQTDRALRVFAIAIVVALGIALLAVALGPHRVGDYFTETDFYGGYSEGARAIQHGRLDPSRYGVVGPVYEIVLAVVGLGIRDLLTAAEMISVASVLAGALLWFGLLSRRAGVRLGLAALLFLATNGTLFRYGYSATTDALAFALQALAMTLLLARSTPRAAVAAGIVAALAFLTRYSAAYLLPMGIVAALAGGTLQPGRGRAALLFAAGFAAPVLPWVLYSLAHGGTFATQLHHNIAYDVFARSKGIPWDEYQRTLQPQFKSLGDVIARDPAGVVRRELFNVYDHLRLDARVLLGWPVAAAAVAGLVLGARDGTLRRLWPLWLAGALGFLMLVPVFYSERYSLGHLPFYAALAGMAFASPLLAFERTRPPHLWLKTALAVVLLVIAGRASLHLQERVMNQLPVEVLDCAPTLRAEARPGDRVIARKPHIAFHGGVTPVPFPFTQTLPELAAYARETKSRWMYFSWPEAEMRPTYSYLLDTSGAVPGLTVRKVSPGHPAVLYEIGPDFGKVPAWLTNDTLTGMHLARSRLMINARDVRALYTLGYIERTRGNVVEAQRLLERAARIEPGNTATALLLGEVYLLKRDTRSAARSYQHALDLDPTSVAAVIGLGWSALLDGNTAETARRWRPVISRTRDASTLRRMVELFSAMGDAEAATQARATLGALAAAPAGAAK